jgi:hypothetical protein
MAGAHGGIEDDDEGVVQLSVRDELEERCAMNT